jgi:predicted nucleic acid-binding protein
MKAFIWVAQFASAELNSMSGRSFIDTSVLVYAHDIDAGAKHQIANTVLRELWSERTGVLSVQVLQEFYVNVTKKIPSPLSKDKARLVVSSYAIWCREANADEVATAFRIEDESRISFWDALIVSSAAKCGATRILSEDLNAGQRIAGILIENPFVGIP